MYNIYYVSRLFPMVNCQAFSHTDGNPNNCVNGFKTCALSFVTAFNWKYLTTQNTCNIYLKVNYIELYDKWKYFHHSMSVNLFNVL